MTLDWAGARNSLLSEEAKQRADWYRLHGHVAGAQQHVRSRRHLDALVELHHAADLEYELTGDSESTGRLIAALVAELGIEHERVHEAWMRRSS
ncbi:MAG TPA: hypothetical protein ENK57_06435 [Polyangiaceae bacterium]|nr:hypothetical protein [Polyangiaceae bacterium]